MAITLGVGATATEECCEMLRNCEPLTHPHPGETRMNGQQIAQHLREGSVMSLLFVALNACGGRMTMAAVVGLISSAVSGPD